MPINGFPRRVFLDTNIVNFILDFGEQIHENAPISESLGKRESSDIEALQGIFNTGSRALWQLAISPHTFQEIIRTKDSNRQKKLGNWFIDIWAYWHSIIEEHSDLPDFIESENLRIKLLADGSLDCFEDIVDRVLICDAIIYRCDLFCTRDWSTILRFRDSLNDLPIKIVTPTEWWKVIEPYSAIWH